MYALILTIFLSTCAAHATLGTLDDDGSSARRKRVRGANLSRGLAHKVIADEGRVLVEPCLDAGLFELLCPSGPLGGLHGGQQQRRGSPRGCQPGCHRGRQSARPPPPLVSPPAASLLRLPDAGPATNSATQSVTTIPITERAMHMRQQIRNDTQRTVRAIYFSRERCQK
ncbi:hypothetical protein MRX96_006488 [Rhipicephalus microplus]